MTLGRLWWLFRRDWNRGICAAWHDRVTCDRIQTWRVPDRMPESPVPVHLLTGKDTWRLALWALASLTHFSARRWRITIHDDGSLDPAAIKAIDSVFPGTRFVPAAESDARMEDDLANYPECLAYRRSHPLAKKCFDAAAYAESERFILLDSDVAFFDVPGEILEWVDHEEDRACWFNADFQEPSPVSAAEAEEKFGIDLWPKVNSGLCLLNREIVDLDLCERVLRESALKDGHIWRWEQTLLALCASAKGEGGLLPLRYEVSPKKWRRPDAIARHYVGEVRDRFYAEAVVALNSILLG